MQSPKNGNSIRILALAGSFRKGSFNRALIRAAREPAPGQVRIDDLDLRTAPFYDGDLEAAGYPAEITALKGATAWPDALLIATPEYKRSVPVVLKKAIDWASLRPPYSPLKDKPAAVMGPARLKEALSAPDRICERSPTRPEPTSLTNLPSVWPVPSITPPTGGSRQKVPARRCGSSLPGWPRPSPLTLPRPPESQHEHLGPTRGERYRHPRVRVAGAANGLTRMPIYSACGRSMTRTI